MTTPSNIDPDREAVARIFWTRDGECPTYPWTEYLNDADAVLALLRERGRLVPLPQEMQSKRLLYEKLQHQAWDPSKAHAGGYAIEYDGNNPTKVPDAPAVVTDAVIEKSLVVFYDHSIQYGRRWAMRRAVEAALAEMAKQ